MSSAKPSFDSSSLFPLSTCNFSSQDSALLSSESSREVRCHLVIIVFATRPNSVVCSLRFPPSSISLLDVELGLLLIFLRRVKVDDRLFLVDKIESQPCHPLRGKTGSFAESSRRAQLPFRRGLATATTDCELTPITCTVVSAPTASH